MSWMPLKRSDLALVEKRLSDNSYPGKLEGVYSQPTFYRNGALIRLMAGGEGAYFVATGVGPIGERGFYRLDGYAAPIYEANRSADIMLATEEQAADYLRFYCRFLNGPKGKKFNIFEDMDGWKIEGQPNFVIEPLLVLAHGNGPFFAQACVEYEQHLFLADFRIHPDGFVEMTDDAGVGPLVPSILH